MNPQWRIFRPRAVVQTDAIHTPGLALEEFLLAPEDTFFIHLDWVVRSLPERREKLARYERQRAGRASISSSPTRQSCTIRWTGA